ncbi:MAG TPA: hypothetical protein VGA70_12425 [Longimicrobiales bacterium]|jgi:hypothetical protein
MARIPPGSQVALRPGPAARLSHLPPPGADLVVAVHEGALRALGNVHTQLAGFQEGDLAWAGAVGEDVLEVLAAGGGSPRMLLADHLERGERLWEVVWPGDLLRDPSRGPLSTLYLGSRPWLVVGELTSGDLLAVPLGDAGNPMWFTPVLRREDVRFSGSHKDSQAELGHLWSLPAAVAAVGDVAPRAADLISRALRDYF